MATIFLDGAAGTTGLQIRDRLAPRDDIELVELVGEARKDPACRADALNAADLTILCLPDDAARESVALAKDDRVRILDASTAHRVAEGWVYGMPEYAPGHADRIRGAARVSNPGCYAVASVSLLHPLVAGELLPADTPVSIHATSGYSGGGRQMIEQYESVPPDERCEVPLRLYGLDLEHKHVGEIHAHSGLTLRPIFVPSVGRYPQGMVVQIALQLSGLPGRPSPGALREQLQGWYRDSKQVEVCDAVADARSFRVDADELAGSDLLRLHVFGHDDHEQAVLVAVLDNLGKGAAGSAVQNAELMLESLA